MFYVSNQSFSLFYKNIVAALFFVAKNIINVINGLPAEIGLRVTTLNSLIIIITYEKPLCKTIVYFKHH